MPGRWVPEGCGAYSLHAEHKSVRRVSVRYVPLPLVIQVPPSKADVLYVSREHRHEKEPRNFIHSCARAQLRSFIACVRA